MSWRTVVRAGAGILLLVVLVLVAPFVRLALDEGAVPDASDGPPLPAGVTVGRDEVSCGSGGCWRELTLRVPDGQPPAEVAASLGPPGWTCRHLGLLDRRQVCSGVEADDEDVVVTLYFDRSSVP